MNFVVAAIALMLVVAVVKLRVAVWATGRIIIGAYLAVVVVGAFLTDQSRRCTPVTNA